MNGYITINAHDNTISAGQERWDFTQMRALTPAGEEFINPFSLMPKCTAQSYGDSFRRWEPDLSMESTVTYENLETTSWRNIVIGQTDIGYGSQVPFRNIQFRTTVSYTFERVIESWWSFICYECKCSTESGNTQWFWEETLRSALVPIKVLRQPFEYAEYMTWTYHSWAASETSLLRLIGDVLREKL